MRLAHVTILVALAAGMAAAQDAPAAKAPAFQPAFEPAPHAPVTAEQFIDLDVRTGSTAYYLGLQISTGAEDVVYLVFDAPEGRDVRDRAQVFRPTAAGLGRTDVLRGRPEILLAKGGAGFIKARRFRLRDLEAPFRDGRTSCDIEIVSGYRHADALLLQADVLLRNAGSSSRYRVGGLLTPYLATQAEGLRALPLLTGPRLYARPGRPAYDRINIALFMGKLAMLPGSGMDRGARAWLTVQVEDDPQRSAYRKWKLREKVGVRPWEWLCALRIRVQPGTSYLCTSALDLGPMLGVVEDTYPFAVPEK